MMTSIRDLSMVALVASLATGCGMCGESSDAAASTETPQPTSSAPQAPETPTPTVEQLPLPQDFAQHAGQRVTDDTYLDELARIEGEVGPIPEDAFAQPSGGLVPSMRPASR